MPDALAQFNRDTTSRPERYQPGAPDHISTLGELDRASDGCARRNPRKAPAGERLTALSPRVTSGRRYVVLGVWYRYGDSNPGPVAENHVS